MEPNRSGSGRGNISPWSYNTVPEAKDKSPARNSKSGEPSKPYTLNDYFTQGEAALYKPDTYTPAAKRVCTTPIQERTTSTTPQESFCFLDDPGKAAKYNKQKKKTVKTTLSPVSYHESFWDAPHAGESSSTSSLLSTPLQSVDVDDDEQQNTCFMNAALQTIADLTEHFTPEPDEIPDDIKARLNYDVKKYALYFTLRENTLKLCKHLRKEGAKATRIPEGECESAYAHPLMKKFIKSYIAYEKASRTTAQEEDEEDKDESILNDHQQDPQEFLDKVCEVLELNRSENSSLMQVSLLRLERGREKLFSRTAKGSDRSTLLTLSVPQHSPDRQMPGVTLQHCIDLFQQKDDLSPDSRIKWTDQELQKAGLIKDDARLPLKEEERQEALRGTKDSKQMLWAFTGEKPPAVLLVLAKLSVQNPTTHETHLLLQEGKELLQTLDTAKHVTIPCYKASTAEDGQNYRFEGKMINQRYKVSSVVAHEGTNPVTGHFVSVREQPEGYLMRDDGFTYSPYKGPLLNLFQDQNVAGYLFALQAVEDRQGEL